MQRTILLNADENTKQVEKEEQFYFIKSVIEALDIPISWNFDEPYSFSVKDKIAMRNALSQFSIEIIDDNDGTVTIYHEKEKIAEWKKCTYKLKRDYSKSNPKKQLYLEMQANFWTIFESEPNE